MSPQGDLTAHVRCLFYAPSSLDGGEGGGGGEGGREGGRKSLNGKVFKLTGVIWTVCFGSASSTPTFSKLQLSKPELSTRYLALHH
ncbi:hypothetical protein AMECASPLE_021617 [Ameca splendens]|uniref:Uncharacterized protein n=1 Tax=Ameca splendens TaxID=208324 RepID=A0ABV0Y3M7_9TELE